MKPISRYTFVKVDFLSKLDDDLRNTYQGVIDKTSDEDNSFQNQCQFVPPYTIQNHSFSRGFMYNLERAVKNYAGEQQSLFHMYSSDYTVKKDMFASYWWLLRAASNGHKYARIYIAKSYSHEISYFTEIIPQDYHKSLQWWFKYDSKSSMIAHFKEKYNCVLSEKDKDVSIKQLVADADKLLSKAYQKRREEEQRINNYYEIKKFKRTRNPTKEQLKENFDPFIFHIKRK